jgi:hypothetical protein
MNNKEYYDKLLKNECPSCGTQLRNEGKCSSCPNCFWSKCNV